MPKIGQEFVSVEDYSTCLVVYIKEPSSAHQGSILVKHTDKGREWLTPDQLKNDYVER